MLMYYVYIILFGMMGAMSRYALGLFLYAEQIPLATLIINIAGCFLLAFTALFLTELPFLSRRLTSAIGTGFIGSFTTFSTFSLESAELLQAGNYFSAFGYIAASIFGGLFACVLGYEAGRLLLKRGGKANAD